LKINNRRKKKLRDNYMKKTVLFVLDEFHIGGVTTFIKQYADVVKSKGKTIILAFKSNITNPADYFPGSEIIIIDIEQHSGLINRIKYAANFLIHLNRIYRKHDVGIVHFSTPWSALFAILHPKTWTKKRVVTFYGALDLEESSAYLGREQGSRLKISIRIKNILKKKIQEFILTVSHKIITFSTYAKKLIEGYYSKEIGQKVNIIPGYIDVNLNMEIVGKSHRKFTIVNFGRAEPRKGLDLLLEAVYLLKKQTKVKLYIASPVTYWDSLDLFKKYEELNLFDDVHFLHKLNNQQKKYLLSLADIFIMPSKDLETFGMTIIESLAAGVPVIGTPVGAIPEILSKVDSLLVTEKISSKSIYEKLVWYLSLNGTEKLKIKKKGQSVVKKFYSRELVEPLLAKVYADLGY